MIFLLNVRGWVERIDFGLCLAEHRICLQVDDCARCGHVLAMLDERKYLEILEKGVSDVFVDHAVAVDSSDD